MYFGQMNRYFESQLGTDSYQNSYEAKVGYKKCFLNKICPFLAHSVPVALCFVGVHSFQSLSSKVLRWAVFMTQNLGHGLDWAGWADLECTNALTWIRFKRISLTQKRFPFLT